MGISAEQILGQSPEFLQQQAAQRRIQGYMAPFQTQQERTAGLLGGLLGGGVANLFAGRGFFDVTDPTLQRVSDVNKIISDGLKDIDPTDPEAMATAYGSIAKQLAAAGYSQPAALAAGEAAKMKAAIGAGFKESSNYMTKDGTPALYKNGRYYDAQGNELGPKDLRIIPKDSLGRIINTATAGEGATGDDEKTKAAKALAERRAKDKAAQVAATADPLEPKWDDDPATKAKKAQARAERDAEKAKELSAMGGIGTEMVAP